MIPISQYRIKTTHNILQPRPAIAVTVFRRLSHVDCSTCPSPTQHVQNVTIPHARCATKDVSRKGTHIHRSSTPHTPIHQNLQPLQQSLRSFPSSLHPCTQSTRSRSPTTAQNTRAIIVVHSVMQAIFRAIYHTHTPHRSRLLPLFQSHFLPFRTLCQLFFFFFVSFPIFVSRSYPFKNADILNLLIYNHLN